MKMRMLPLTLGLSGTAMAAALILPAIAQESLLPEGFSNPAETPAPKSSPAPGAAPTPTPAPTTGAAPPSVAPTLGTTTVTPAADAGEDEEAGEKVESGALKYDHTPGARPPLTPTAPLTPHTAAPPP